MKVNLKAIAVLTIFFGAITNICSQGYLVPGGVTFHGYIPGAGSEFHVLQNPTNMDYTGFFLVPQDADTFQISFFLDERVRVFFVSANQPFALQSILSEDYLEYLGTSDFAYGVPFYLGLYTGYSPQNGIYENPMFGWAQLVNNNGVIELLDSALAYGADGIYVGTQNIIQPVPEPSVFSLITLGMVAMVWRWRRKVGT